MSAHAVRAVGRIPGVLLHTVAGWWRIRRHFHRLDARQREAEVQAWAHRMLTRMGVALEVKGPPPAAGPLLLVANHHSWLDITVLHAARHCRFVSKSEIAYWPLVGTLAGGAGTLYIERASRRDALRVAHRMADALRDGDVLAVFPEGTTNDGTQLLPFHGNLLQAAISTATPVQPVAIRFLDAATRQPSAAPRYALDDTLLGSLWKVLGARGTVAVVRYGAPQAAGDRDRRAWAQELHAQVAGLLSEK